MSALVMVQHAGLNFRSAPSYISELLKFKHHSRALINHNICPVQIGQELFET